MSRALNVDATPDQVLALAAKHGVAISAIEPLDPTGTRVILMTSEGAETMAAAYGKRVLTGRVSRTPWAQRRI